MRRRRGHPVADAVAGVVVGSTEGEFGFGVFWPVRAHYAGDGFALWRGRSFVAYVADGKSLPAKYAEGTKVELFSSRSDA